MSTDENLLAEMDMVLVGIDRPCYGASDPCPSRSALHTLTASRIAVKLIDTRCRCPCWGPLAHVQSCPTFE